MAKSEKQLVSSYATPETSVGSTAFKSKWRVIKRSRSTSKAVVLLTLLYFLAWGPLLLSVNGVWWDDWTIVTGSTDSITEMFEQNGLPWIGTMHVFLTQFGPAVYHIVSLILFLLTGLLLWGILGTFSGLAWWERFFVTALFLVLPFNAARNTMIVLPYTISLFLFFLGWYLLVRTAQPRRLLLVLSAVVFMISFTMNSLLVFYAVPIAHVWWRSYIAENESSRTFIKARWPFLVLPFVFFGIKTIWFSPSGAYAGYNSFSWRGVAEATLLLTLTLVPFLVLLSERTRLSSIARRVWLLAFCGLVLVALAVFPYMAVGHSPPFPEWQTRDQILIPLGAAILLLAAERMVRWRFGPRAAATFAVVVIAISIALSARIGMAYWVDWRKQQAIVAVLTKDEIVRNGDLIVFQDDTISDNMFGSPYRIYAWNGILTRAFGDSRRLGLNPHDVPTYLAGDLRSYYSSDQELGRGDTTLVEIPDAVIFTIKAGSSTGEYEMSSISVATEDLTSMVGGSE